MKMPSKFLALWLVVALGLPSPALALRQTGLEESEKQREALATQLRNPAPPTTTGLEEKWSWSDWTTSRAFDDSTVQEVWEFMQTINSRIQEALIHAHDSGGIFGALGDFDSPYRSRGSWAYPRCCVAASELAALILQGKFSDRMKVFICEDPILAPPYDWTLTGGEEGYAHQWVLLQVGRRYYYLSLTDGLFAWNADPKRARKLQTLTTQKWELFHEGFIEPYRKQRFDQVVLSPWNKIARHFKAGPKGESPFEPLPLSDYDGSSLGATLEEFLEYLDDETITLIFKGLASLKTPRGRNSWEHDSLEAVVDALFTHGRGGGGSWEGDLAERVAKAIRHAIKGGQTSNLPQYLRDIDQSWHRGPSGPVKSIISRMLGKVPDSEGTSSKAGLEEDPIAAALKQGPVVIEVGADGMARLNGQGVTIPNELRQPGFFEPGSRTILASTADATTPVAITLVDALNLLLEELKDPWPWMARYVDRTDVITADRLRQELGALTITDDTVVIYNAGFLPETEVRRAFPRGVFIGVEHPADWTAQPLSWADDRDARVRTQLPHLIATARRFGGILYLRDTLEITYRNDHILLINAKVLPDLKGPFHRTASGMEEPRFTPEAVWILLVEDNSSILAATLQLIKLLLPSSKNPQVARINLGHIGTATTLEEAQAWIREHKPQVVVTDLNLPDGLGFQVADVARTADPLAIVMLAAAPDQDQRPEVGRYLSTGRFAEFFEKPFGIRQLMAAMERHLGPRLTAGLKEDPIAAALKQGPVVIEVDDAGMARLNGQGVTIPDELRRSEFFEPGNQTILVRAPASIPWPSPLTVLHQVPLGFAGQIPAGVVRLDLTLATTVEAFQRAIIQHHPYLGPNTVVLYRASLLSAGDARQWMADSMLIGVPDFLDVWASDLPPWIAAAKRQGGSLTIRYYTFTRYRGERILLIAA